MFRYVKRLRCIKKYKLRFRISKKLFFVYNLISQFQKKINKTYIEYDHVKFYLKIIAATTKKLRR